MAFMAVYWGWGVLASVVISYVMLTLDTPMMEYWDAR